MSPYELLCYGFLLFCMQRVIEHVSETLVLLSGMH